jgi:DNA-binding transcriptional LysR family regulator
MNTDAILAFVAVAEEGQFQRAADQLGISQQAVSKRVAALETELGTALFRRTPAGAVLTGDGRTFLPHARAVTAAVRAAVESVQPRTRPLRVDVLSRINSTVELLREFQAARPERLVRAVTGGGAAATLRGLLAGEIDVGYAYVRDRAELGPALSSAYAYLEPVQVVVGPRHPLARAGRIRPADLARYPAWVPGIVAGSEWETFHQDLAADFGLTIDPTNYATGTESVFADIAASRTLVTYVSEKNRIALPDGAGLLRLPLTDPQPAYPWSLIWPARPAHPAVRQLVAHTRRRFRPPDPAAVWLPRQARDDFKTATQTGWV